METESPLNPTVDDVLPGVLAEFIAVRRDIVQGNAATHQKVDALTDMVQRGFENQDVKMRALAQAIGTAFLSYSGSGQLPESMSQPFPEFGAAVATANTVTDSLAIAPITDAELSPPPFHRLYPTHNSLLSIWNEWYGNEEFNNRPVVGGLKRLEQSFGSKWRSHFSQGERTAFSRMKSIILGIENYAVSKGMSSGMSIAELDEIFQARDGCKSQLAQMVKWFQDGEYIQKKQARGKHAVAPS